MPLHQEPSQTGVKAWPESRGEPGLWPGFGHVGQGIKKPGSHSHRVSLAGPGCSWPWPKLRRESKRHTRSTWPEQAIAGQGQNWQSPARKSRKVWPIIGLHWPPLAGPKIGLACQETLTSLAKIKLQGNLHTCSGFTLSGQSYRIISPPKLPETTKTCTIINMTIIAMLCWKSV